MSIADAGPKLIRVVVAGDHHSKRESLRSAVDPECDMICVGVATSGREALEMTIEELPDVLVIAAEMHDLDGIAVAFDLRRLAPRVRTILYETEGTLPELARRAHVTDLVATGASVSELLTAIRSAALATSTRI
jgi:DNA-binding NarL/FixJ family response regulator